MNTPHAHVDFETRSRADLKKVGLWRYGRDASTAAWCAAWAIGDTMDPEVWVPGQPMPEALRQHVEAGFPVYAHNAPFELEIWNTIMVRDHGWCPLAVEQTYCTMVMAYAMGLPGGLEDAALAMGLPALKDVDGRALMLRMARPRSDKGGVVTWWDEPEKLARLYAYCQQDVRVERELAARLMQLSPEERRVWLMDYRINRRGVCVDLPTARAGVNLTAQIKLNADASLSKITGGRVTSATALIPLKEWLAEQGVDAPSLAKAAVGELLDDETLPPAARAAIKVRSESNKASLAKLDRMINLAGDDGRLHNMFQYHGATTGRWAGRGVQPHNLIRDVPKPHVVEEILALVRSGDLDWLTIAHGAPMDAISRCLRSFFIAAPGHKLLAGDFSAVEGRGTAWFSGEEWKLDAFRAADAGTGPGIYEMAYAKTFGVDPYSVKDPSPERQKGKVMELALGYGGGKGALRKMGGKTTANTPDAELDQWKTQWRAVHPAIVRTWAELEAAAIDAVRNPGIKYDAGACGRHVRFLKSGSFLWCQLPSGRVICYPYPKILPGKWSDQLTYMTVPSMNDSAQHRIIADVANSSTWARVATYGGSLMENVVQALCRDLLSHVLLQLDAAGANVVLHVHDEAVVEVAEATAERAREAMESIMNAPPAWAAGFPMHTKVKIMTRYGK